MLKRAETTLNVLLLIMTNFLNSVVDPLLQKLVGIAQIVKSFSINTLKVARDTISRNDFTPITFIKLKDLLSDGKYQRLVDEKFIKKQGKFKPELVRPLIIALRPKKLGGQKVVVDGQHTACLAEIYTQGGGEQELPCQIPPTLRHPEDRSLEDCVKVEAKFFDDTNYIRNNPNSIARLRAGIASGHQNSLDWLEIFMNLGIHIEKVGDEDGQSVYGLAKLKTCVNKYGQSTTKDAVKLYADTIKYSTKDVWDSPILGGLLFGITASLHFANNYLTTDKKAGFKKFLAERLTMKSPKEWTEKTSGVIMDLLIVEDKFVDTYNILVAAGVLDSPRIGQKVINNWKLDEIHNKSTRHKEDVDDD